MRKTKEFFLKALDKSKSLFAFLAITLIASLISFLVFSRFIKPPDIWMPTVLLGFATSMSLIRGHDWLDRIADGLLGVSKRYYKGGALILILAGVWYGFIRLVEHPPLDTTSVMIMLWSTAVILVLALFPSIFDLIKKIKIGDIEIELKDVISKSSPQDYITTTEISGTSIYAQKGDARNLQTILTEMMQEPGKPILLTVNLGRAISKTFLFVYVFLIELFSASVVVFVVKRSQLRNINDLKETDVSGVISGQRLINAYLRRFPSLLRIFYGRTNGFGDNAYASAGLVQIPSEEIIETVYNLCEMQIENDLAREGRGDFERENRSELLNKREIETWLKDKLDSKFIDKSFGKNDLDVLRQCIISSDEFVILTENKKIVSVTRVETLTRNISKNLLTQITGSR